MVLKKNKILFLIALVLFIMTAVFIYQYFFQIKKITFKTALNLAHRMAGKSEYPTRFNAQSPVLAREGIAIFTASSLDRIFSDGKTLLKPHFAASRSIFLARNEYESFQVVVQSKGREIHDVQLSFSDFVNIKAGTKINQRNLTWRVVGFVKTFEPYYPVKYIGLWPDPLLPPHKVNVKKNFTQPFWITFYASKDCLPGDYEGFVFIQSGSQILQSVPVKIHIYNFELPITSHLKTAFDFYSHMTKLRYLQDSHEADDTYQARLNNINDQYISTMLQYRMNPILNVDPSDQMELSAIDRYLVLGLNNFSIGKRGGTFNNNWPHTDGAIDNLFSLYRTYGEDLKLNGMLAYSYIYLWDEGKMGDPQVKKIASMIHRAYPALRTMVCYHGIWDPSDGADWLNDIDIWTFQIDDFNEKKMRKLQAMGKEIWMYISGPSGADTPNLAIDFDSIDYRIIPWLCWKYDIKGFLYWCVNWWPTVDPFESAKNSQWDQNGNGLLIYPGKNGPLASIRMELFRDGMEDYEYIQILFEDLKSLKLKGLIKAHQEYYEQSVKLLTMDDSIAASMSKFTRSEEILNARRNAIAAKIEEYNSWHLL